MKIIEGPVKAIEQGTELKQIQMKIGVLLKSLKNIYDSSNFYKEARIVSFLDRLLQTITSKIKAEVNVPKCIKGGETDVDAMQEQINSMKQIIHKF